MNYGGITEARKRIASQKREAAYAAALRPLHPTAVTIEKVEGTRNARPARWEVRRGGIVAVQPVFKSRKEAREWCYAMWRTEF
jgi:hypothetical protein